MLLNIKPQPNPHGPGRSSRGEPGMPNRSVGRIPGSVRTGAGGAGPRTCPAAPPGPAAPDGRCRPRRRRGSHGNRAGPGAGACALRSGAGPAGRAENTPGREGSGREESEAVRKDEQPPWLPPAPARTRAGSPAAAVPTL